MKVLAFIRISSSNQSFRCQIKEISEQFTTVGTKIKYISMTGSTFRDTHPTMTRKINNMLTNNRITNDHLNDDHLNDDYDCLAFAAVDRIGRNFETSYQLLKKIKKLNKPVIFARTPTIDIHSKDGWNKTILLLKSADIEAKNISARSKNSWMLKKSKLLSPV